MGRAVERVFVALHEDAVRSSARRKARDVKGYCGPSRFAFVDLDFSKALQECLDQVGPGRVTTCGAIARALGDVRASRAVATWIATHPDISGGHRVVRADGRPVLGSSSGGLSREGTRLFRGRVSADRIMDSLESVRFLAALREEQRKLADRVIEQDGPRKIERVAGVDAGYDGNTMHTVAVSLDAKDFALTEIAAVKRQAVFPYIPTFLAYREFSGIEAAVSRLKRRPDVLLIDGHGRLHPALFGIACYVGARLGLPTIGVAKHPLVGRVRRGNRSASGEFAVEFRGKVRGYAWTPPGRERPIYVSIGHRVSLERALEIVRGCTLHAYPEPLRLADRIGREMKRNRRNEKREKGATR